MLKLSSTYYNFQAILLDQYKQKGYVQKLKTVITPDFMCSGRRDLATLLYMAVTQIDGMYIG